MSKTIKREGRCLCGDVKVIAHEAETNLGVCHCGMCRKWVGGPFFAIDCGTKVTFEGKPSISTYASSDWAERSFCKRCGSSLYYRLKASGQYIMSLGLFDIDKSTVFDHQIFIDEKPPYYSFSNKTKNMTGEEVFAHFASQNKV